MVPDGVAPPRVDRITLVISVVLLLLFGASVALVWQLGLFDENTRASNAQVIAAALALVGVLVTASLTFAGVLLKHSIDRRTVQQAAETEGRLRLETSISAVQLLTEEGKPATQTRQAGALFVLVNLNQLDFAYALLGQMWANRDISPGAAVWVVNRLLLSGDPSLQHQAATIVDRNAETLAGATDWEFPNCVELNWTNNLPSPARETLLSAFVKMMLAKSRVDWWDQALNAFVVQLDVVRRTENEDHIRGGAILCLDALLDVLDHFPAGTVLFAPDGALDVDALSSELATLVPVVRSETIVSEHLDLANRLRKEWQ